MASVNFYLKNPKEENKASLIYLFFSFSGKRLKYSTSENIQPKHWNAAKQRVKRTYTGSVEVNAYLSRIEEEALKIHRMYLVKGESPSTETIRQDLKEAFSKLENDNMGFFYAYDLFIELTKDRVKERTTKKYRTLKNHLTEFKKITKQPIEFDTIDIHFFEKFVNFYIKNLGLLNNTIGKYTATLKTFLSWAAKRKYHKNYEFLEFKVLKEEADIVYLEYAELMKLYELDLEAIPRLANVRDVFCFGCFTGLRFSDIQQLKKEDIRKDTINLNSIKTKESLRIPLNQFAQNILSKFDNKEAFLHVISNQKMNAYLKELCKMAGIDAPITLTKFRGSERIEFHKPKHDFISTHTARRTFVTLSLEQGMRPEIVMQITGHKDYKTFKKYIKLTDKVKEVEMRKVWGKQNMFIRIS